MLHDSALGTTPKAEQGPLKGPRPLSFASGCNSDNFPATTGPGNELTGLVLVDEKAEATGGKKRSVAVPGAARA